MDQNLVVLNSEISPDQKTDLAAAQPQAVKDLASLIAHQINNPLTIILSRASFLKEKIKAGQYDETQAIEALAKIESATLRIANTIRTHCDGKESDS